MAKQLIAVEPDGKTTILTERTTAAELTRFKAIGAKCYSIDFPPLSLLVPFVPFESRYSWVSPETERLRAFQAAQEALRQELRERARRAVELLATIARVCVRAALETLLELDSGPLHPTPEPLPYERPIELD